MMTCILVYIDTPTRHSHIYMYLEVFDTETTMTMLIEEAAVKMNEDALEQRFYLKLVFRITEL